MRVSKIGHATLIVDAGRMRCLMDPILLQPFECEFNRFEPPVSIDTDGLTDHYNLIVVSHEHMDHFCVRSLNLLSRKCPVIIPLGCGLLHHTLTTMGFERVYTARAGETLTFEDVALTFTPSNVRFPELGVLFTHNGLRFWNCVDSEIDERALTLVRRQGADLNLMFAQYQCLLEEELGYDALGASFPLDTYRNRVEAVIRAEPRCVVPSACGYRYETDTWLNQRGFPVSERQFLDDIAMMRPQVVRRSVAPGAAIDVESFEVEADSLPFTKRLGSSNSTLDWRPDRGVPPLRDSDPYGHGTRKLRRAATLFLTKDFPSLLNEPHLGEWRNRLARYGIVWQLELVYPSGKGEVRWLDFRETSRWLSVAPAPPKLITAICASTLVGLMRGEITPYRALFSRRVVLKLYAYTAEGLMRIGTLADEPIARTLFGPAVRAYVDTELERLGYGPGQQETAT
jgi:hypothetical protein